MNRNICLVCQEPLGNINPKSRKNIMIYQYATHKYRAYKLRGFAHRKCVEASDGGLLIEWD